MLTHAGPCSIEHCSSGHVTACQAFGADKGAEPRILQLQTQHEAGKEASDAWHSLSRAGEFSYHTPHSTEQPAGKIVRRRFSHDSNHNTLK